MKGFIEKVPESQKEIIKAVGPIVIVMILFLVAGRIVFTQYTSLRSKVAEAKKAEAALSDKLAVLRTVSDMGGVDFAVYALPKSNPVVQVVSHLKLLSAMNSVVLSDVKSSISTENKGADLSYISTTFKITGTRPQIMSFIAGIERIAPITLVDKIDLSESSGINIANISTKTYFSPLPTKIPSVTQAVTDLTASEKTLVTQISQLAQPLLLDTKSSSVSAVNANPFGD